MHRGGTGLLPWFQRPRPGHPFLAGAPLLIAHRGGAGLAPENTIEACENALSRYDADMLEVDVRLTADGKVVLHHDETLDRTTDGRGRLKDRLYAEVRELDAGCGFVASAGGRPYAGRGVRVPLLEELLDCFPRTRVIVEIKEPEAAAPTDAIVRRLKAAHRVLISAEYEERRRGALGHAGAWGASRRQILPFWLLHRTPLSRFTVPPVDVIQAPLEWNGRAVVTPRFVVEAHRRNIPVHVWTVDDEPAMRRLLEWGVDGILTDRPDRLAAVLHEWNGRRLPKALAQESDHGVGDADRARGPGGARGVAGPQAPPRDRPGRTPAPDPSKPGAGAAENRDP